MVGTSFTGVRSGMLVVSTHSSTECRCAHNILDIPLWGKNPHSPGSGSTCRLPQHTSLPLGTQRTMAVLTASSILEIARKVVAIFEGRGLRCCLMGSAASYLYGVSRVPNDIDVVVLTSVHTQEDLKDTLVSADPKFYLVRSRNPRATYRVLWYRLPGRNQRCKVDILIPGILNVPNVPPVHIRMATRGSYYLPVMPPIPQLLLKLQGWTDHRASARLDMWMKQYLDVRDIDALLEIMCGKGLRIDDTDAEWVPQTMIAAALDTVRTYVVIASPASMYNWRKLGFDISAELSRITSV